MDTKTIIIAIIYLILLAITVVEIIARWKIYKKAGEKGWKSLIPFYNEYIFYKIVWKIKYFWITFGFSMLYLVGYIIFYSGEISFGNTALILASGLAMLIALLVNSVFKIIFMVKLSYSFGKKIGFSFGLIFLESIFIMILAFGKAEYKKLESNIQ